MTDDLQALLAGIVKPLEWRSVAYIYPGHLTAETMNGHYNIAPDEDNPSIWLMQWTSELEDFLTRFGGKITKHPSQECAIAAAQSDYTARIASALNLDALARMLADARAEAFGAGYDAGFGSSDAEWNGDYHPKEWGETERYESDREAAIRAMKGEQG